MTILTHYASRAKNSAHLAWLKAMKSFWALPSVSLGDLVSPDIRLGDAILEKICLPPYFGPKGHDDYSPLLRIIKSAKPAVVLELGTAHGNTVANICRECTETRVYTVNAPAELQSGDCVSFALTPEEIGCVYRKHGFAGRVTQILENTLFLDLSQYLKEGKVDVAIIDACHDREYVINDFLKVEPFVRPGGVVLLHDTHPSLERHLKGGYAACMSLRRRGYDIRHLENTWWGVWIKPQPSASRK